MNNMESTEETYIKELKRKTKFANFFAILCAVLFVISLVFIILYQVKESEYCSDRECVRTASRMIEVMDITVDPCDNFYNYACGNWIRKTRLETNYNRFKEVSESNKVTIKQVLESGKVNASKALTKAIEYYTSCVAVNKIQPAGYNLYYIAMKELLKRLGSWPVIDRSFNSSGWDLMKTIVLLNRDVGRKPLFSLAVMPDIRNTSVNVLTFDQSGLSEIINTKSYFSNQTNRVMERKFYMAWMTSAATRMGANHTGLTYMGEVFKFERELAKVTNTTVGVLKRYMANYDTMTLAEFINRTNIPSAWLLEFIQRTVMLEGKNISLNERIVSYNTDYIRKAYKLFMSLKIEIQASYLLWYAVQFLTANIELGYLTGTPRWQTCVDKTIETFAYALSGPFVERAFDEKRKNMFIEMIQGIKKQFEKNIGEMDWLDDTTREYAKKKTSMIANNVGYPDGIFNNTEMQHFYAGIKVNADRYFANVMEEQRFKTKYNYLTYGRPVDKSSWDTHPLDVNAKYSPVRNTITFPAGILRWPFYDRGSPLAVSYGGIGFIVGHEMAHAFDNTGKNFDIQGNYNSWWTSRSDQEFKERSQCLINQYSNFTTFGRYLNGRQTLGQNIADNGGIRPSLQAYGSWVKKNGREKKLAGLNLTPEQLYFLGFAQMWCAKYTPATVKAQIETGEHTIEEFRVKGTLQNTKEFSDVYNCPVGSPMNPERKCRLW